MIAEIKNSCRNFRRKSITQKNTYRLSPEIPKSIHNKFHPKNKQRILSVNFKFTHFFIIIILVKRMSILVEMRTTSRDAEV